MPKFVIQAEHSVTYQFYVEAPDLKEAERIVMDNEHENAELVDEGARNILSTDEVESFPWENE